MTKWAEHATDEAQVRGPFTVDMPPPGGVFVSDMPSGRPALPPKPRIKGVPGATTDTDEDHQPGGGTWADAR